MTAAEIYTAIEQAVTAVGGPEPATVRMGYLSEVQEQKASYPMVLVNPFAGESQITAVGSTLNTSYLVVVLFLASDTIGMASDKLAAGRGKARSNTYAAMDELRVQTLIKLSGIIGGRATVESGSFRPVQTVGTQTLTGYEATLRIKTTAINCG